MPYSTTSKLAAGLLVVLMFLGAFVAPASSTPTQGGPSQADREHLLRSIHLINVQRYRQDREHLINVQRFLGFVQAVKLAQAIENAEARHSHPAAPAPAPTRPAPRQAPAAPSTGPVGRGGICGGDLPPCYVVQRESGFNPQAQNPTSSASGLYQFIDQTWGGYGGYARASQAPASVQAARARQVWAGGAGCAAWSAC